MIAMIEKEGLRLVAYSGGYMDFGLRIETLVSGLELFSNPHYLCNDCYGFDEPEGEEEYSEPWSQETLEERLDWEFGDLVDGALDFSEVSDRLSTNLRREIKQVGSLDAFTGDPDLDLETLEQGAQQGLADLRHLLDLIAEMREILPS